MDWFRLWGHSPCAWACVGNCGAKSWPNAALSIRQRLEDFAGPRATVWAILKNVTDAVPDVAEGVRKIMAILGPDVDLEHVQEDPENPPGTTFEFLRFQLEYTIRQRVSDATAYTLARCVRLLWDEARSERDLAATPKELVAVATGGAA